MVEVSTLLGGQLLGGVWRLHDQPLRVDSGQAWLFEAYDGRTGERAVVKVFRPERTSDFERELAARRKLASARCTRVAAYLGKGAVACGGGLLPFVAMEWAEGTALDQLVPSAVLDLDDRLEIVAQIAEALAEVHSQLIVHCDVKPANVVVRIGDIDAVEPSAAFGVKLVDFGLATLFSDDRDTRLAAPEGTPAYMPPDREVTMRTDVYAVGRLARDVLTRRCRSGNISVAQAADEIATALEEGGRAPAPDLAELFRECLAESAEERPRDAVVLANRLRAALPPRAVRSYPLARALRRWRTVVFGQRTALDERRTLELLHEWVVGFAGAAILSALPDEQTTRALDRLATGEALAAVVNGSRSAVPLRGPAAGERPAVRAALAFWSLRVTRDGLHPVDPSQHNAAHTDATWLPRTLVEHAGDCLREGSAEERAAVTRALLSAMAKQPLFTDFAIARMTRATERSQLTVLFPRERTLEWPRATESVPNEEDPLLVKLDTDGNAVADVEPWSLAPFALLDGDGRDLVFFGGAPSKPPRFTTPFSIKVVPVPRRPPFSAADVPPSVRMPRRNGASALAASVPCAGPPVLELESPSSTYFLTAADEWFALGPDWDVSPIRKQEGSGSAALDDLGNLVVCAYEANLARFGYPDWEYLPKRSPVLSLCRSSSGLVTGDSGGDLELVTSGAAPRRLRLGPPVIALVAPSEGSIAAMCGDRSLRATRWPRETDTRVVVPHHDLGLPCGIFGASNGRLGVFSATRVALIDVEGGETIAISEAIRGGVREVRPLTSERAGYAVLGDDGSLLLIDGALAGPSLVRLPQLRAPITGMRPTPRGGLLFWTLDGELYLLGASGALRRLAEKGVCLAFSMRDMDRAMVVRFQPSEGASIEALITKEAWA